MFESRTMLTLAILPALVVLGLARPKWHELEGYTFEQYKADFNKRYEPHEHATRESLFEQRLKEVKEFNAVPRLWRKGVNHLTDRTEQELAAMRGGVTPSDAYGGAYRPTAYQPTGMPLPDHVDYREAQPEILTAVKDQGYCGSCWAHAATEQLESYNALKTNELFVLSQQQFVSCMNNTIQCGGTGGCFGAVPELAFQYAMQYGQTQEWMYSYSSYNGDSGTCDNSKTSTPFVKPTGYTVLPQNDQLAVMDALANVGPLAIIADASGWSSYDSGIYDGCDYSKNISLDHVIQLVGYGHDAELGQDYWIVRNSWNAKFGEDGYIRLIKENDAECGWNDYWPVCYDNGKQSTISYTCGQCGLLARTMFPHI